MFFPSFNRQIRAIEAVSTVTAVPYDPSTVANNNLGWGLLDEMSISELKERLKIVNTLHEKRVQAKREMIIDELEAGPKVFMIKSHTCALGMETDPQGIRRPVLKPTQFLTNSPAIAKEIQAVCD